MYLKQKNMTIDPEKEDYVWKALNSLATFPIEQRTVTVFTQMVQDVEIRRALKPLTMEGSYGKLLIIQKMYPVVEIGRFTRWKPLWQHLL